MAIASPSPVASPHTPPASTPTLGSPSPASRDVLITSREPPATPTRTLRVSVPLSIPLDDVNVKDPKPAPEAAAGVTLDGGAKTKRIKPEAPKLKRDSLRQREALLRGKEGTRRRQRWENDRLVGNPNFVPPTAADYQPHPVYPRRTVPYHYASLWEHPKFPRNASAHVSASVDRVPRELKMRLKKTHGALGLLEQLERQVREFIGVKEEAEEEEIELSCDEEGGVVVEHHDGGEGVEYSSEEEIVFVSKKTQNSPKKEEKKKKKKRETGMASKKQEEVPREKVLLESLVEDSAAAFGRWLVHSIAKYYGLQSWSVTVGTNPAMRLAYVGVKPSSAKTNVPKPLYLML